MLELLEAMNASKLDEIRSAVQTTVPAVLRTLADR